ncbi:MAG: hypothetical protein ACXWRE_12330 [Pseudobdellovibrionaceae bacterium]
MKNLVSKIMMVFVAAVTLQSFQALAIPSENPSQIPIVNFMMSGGMVGPGGIISRGITVVRSGEVQVHEARSSKDPNHRGEWEQKDYTLPPLNAETMLSLGEAIAQIQGGELINDGGPQCMDAPSYSYNVIRDQKQIPVFRRSGCRDEYLKDEAQRLAATYIKNILDQLNKMIP